jgi:membrane protease YdiL (CAAX protease family)
MCYLSLTLQSMSGSGKIEGLSITPVAQTNTRSDVPMLVCWLGIWIAANLGRFLTVPTAEICFAIALPITTLYVSTLRRAAATDQRQIAYQEGLLCVATGISVFAFVAVTCSFIHIHLTGQIPASQMPWIALVAPLNEEIVFRGILYSFVLAMCGRLGWERSQHFVAIVVSCAFFSVLHGRTSFFLLVNIINGLVFGLVRWQYRSVIASYLCHAAYNSTLLLAGALLPPQ